MLTYTLKGWIVLNLPRLFIQQKWSSCSWLLLREFVRRYNQHQEELAVEGKETDEFFLPAVTYVSTLPRVIAHIMVRNSDIRVNRARQDNL